MMQKCARQAKQSQQPVSQINLLSGIGPNNNNGYHATDGQTAYLRMVYIRESPPCWDEVKKEHERLSIEKN